MKKIKDFLYTVWGLLFILLTQLSLVIFKVFSGVLVADVLGFNVRQTVIFLIVWYVICSFSFMDGIASLLAFLCIVIYSFKFPWMLILLYPYVFWIYTLYITAKIVKEEKENNE